MLGSVAGVVTNCLIGEDALMFKQPLIYSLKTKSQVLAWRMTASQALQQIPQEMQRELMV
jgi:CRP-like cAMP-binding protein